MIGLTKLKASKYSWALAVLLASMVGCGDDDKNGSESPNPQGPISQVTNASEVDALYQQIAELQCRFPNCFDDTTQFLAANLPAECVRIISQEVRGNRENLIDGLENNRLEFNQANYACAYNAFNEGNCNAVAECGSEKLWIAQVAEGGACKSDLECQAGENQEGYCDVPSGEESCSFGVCVVEDVTEDPSVIVGEGAACGSLDGVDNQCSEGLQCDYSVDEPICVPRQTVAVGDTCSSARRCPEGSTCQARDENEEEAICKAFSPMGGPCDNYLSCEPALYCDIAEQPGTCRARIALGQPCTQTETPRSVTVSQCAYGSFCIEGTCRTIKFVGESCELDQECRGRAEEYTCANSICAPVCAD